MRPSDAAARCVDDLGGPVVAAVVDDENVGLRDGIADAAQHGRDVGCLVERGDDDEGPGGEHRCEHRGWATIELDHDVAPCWGGGVRGEQPDDEGHHEQGSDHERHVHDVAARFERVAQGVVGQEEDETARGGDAGEAGTMVERRGGQGPGHVAGKGPGRTECEHRQRSGDRVARGTVEVMDEDDKHQHGEDREREVRVGGRVAQLPHERPRRPAGVQRARSGHRSEQRGWPRERVSERDHPTTTDREAPRRASITADVRRDHRARPTRRHPSPSRARRSRQPRHSRPGATAPGERRPRGPRRRQGCRCARRSR